MKEFIEKLISNLKELKVRDYDERTEMYNVAIDHCISEVNEVATEYKGGDIKNE